jgi:drug/metabolite transporter (DMT)-like permease
MNTALLLGLGSALGYGITDYAARIAGRAVGVWRSMFYGDLAAFIVLSAWFLRSAPDASRVGSTHAMPWAMSIGAGLILLAGAALLTQGLTKGTLAVVAPVTASYGAIAALLSAVTGEHISRNAVIGIAVTVIGVCLVSIPTGGQRRLGEHLHASGFAWAVAAAVCYGVGFWLQGSFAVPALGAFVPVWLSYGIVIIAVPLLRLALKVSLRFPHRAALAPVLVAGLCSAAAYLALTVGQSTGRVAIVVVLSTLASAVTVLLSRLIDRASIAKHQWLAMVLIIGGLIIIKG